MAVKILNTPLRSVAVSTTFPASGNPANLLAFVSMSGLNSKKSISSEDVEKTCFRQEDPVIKSICNGRESRKADAKIREERFLVMSWLMQERGRKVST